MILNIQLEEKINEGNLNLNNQFLKSVFFYVKDFALFLPFFFFDFEFVTHGYCAGLNFLEDGGVPLTVAIFCRIKELVNFIPSVLFNLRLHLVEVLIAFLVDFVCHVIFLAVMVFLISLVKLVVDLMC